ncbi:uncharacterized protein A1O9_10757 [Exophiala aquamarina CBS 119918]|uniref:Glutaredoxin-like protein n=1 Tax=Exophiala aquamarina CBS 119918 TaxID=1182545 RepID=A0A072NZN7_9EURO|nr:uncharacterized protein A1O9_10757 [Exophiala aquamarina CBS 119918]KEF53309.1 hypothetical protein A1O9_10757 [Exophiala aquamarina CBS 119918]
MRATLVRLRAGTRLTLFTRANCGLCDTAKTRIQEFQNRRAGIDYSEIDISGPGQQNWRDVYDFDVPVLHIDGALEQGQTTGLDAAKKLMHRFTVDEIEAAVAQVEKNGS